MRKPGPWNPEPLSESWTPGTSPATGDFDFCLFWTFSVDLVPSTPQVLSHHWINQYFPGRSLWTDHSEPSANISELMLSVFSQSQISQPLYPHFSGAALNWLHLASTGSSLNKFLPYFSRSLSSNFPVRPKEHTPVHSPCFPQHLGPAVCHLLASSALYFNRCLQRTKSTVFSISSRFVHSPRPVFLCIPPAWPLLETLRLASCTVQEPPLPAISPSAISVTHSSPQSENMKRKIPEINNL